MSSTDIGGEARVVYSPSAARACCNGDLREGLALITALNTAASPRLLL
jgi:hypothetical protein